MRYFFIILSLFIIISPIAVTPSAQSANFTMTILISSSDNSYERVAQYLSQAWTPLLVNVEIKGFPKPVFLSKVIEPTDEWDAAIYSFDSVRANAPELYNRFSKTSYIGSHIYNITNTELKPKNQTYDEFETLLKQYDESINLNEKIQYAKQIQQDYNQNWLLDIPLISRSTVVVSWNDFKGFDIDEDIVQSIFLGAHWGSIPEVRDDSRSPTEIHYPVVDSQTIPVPIYSLSRSDYIMDQSIFSSLLLIDKNDNLHPNIAKSYNHTVVDGKSIWTFNLFNGLKWSDGEPITTKDVKFTIDLNTFPWIASSNSDAWKHVEDISIINDTSMSITFSGNYVGQKEAIAKELIIPEHILNTTFTMINGDKSTPYEGGYPGSSPEWVEFEQNPVSAGPYIVDKINSGQSFVLTLNPDYWYPHETINPYYFNYNGTNPVNKLLIDKITYQIADQSTIDFNTQVLLFESGRWDFIEYPSLDPNSKILSDSNYNVQTKGIPGSGLSLIFNSRYKNVGNYDIRKALYVSLNRTIFDNLLGYAQESQGTLFSRYYSQYYDPSAEMQYNYTLAKTLFEKHGYSAISQNSSEDYKYPWQKVPFPFLPAFIAIPITSIITKKFRK